MATVISVPDHLGFRQGASSIHTSRTMMLKELAQVLDRIPSDASAASYAVAIVEQNQENSGKSFPGSGRTAPWSATV